jgi:hypothetical protein
MKTGRSLRELFCFPGFVATATLKGVFGDPKARIVTLRRRKKRPCVPNCGHRCRNRYDKRLCLARDLRVAGWVLHVEFERWHVHCSGCGRRACRAAGLVGEKPALHRALCLACGSPVPEHDQQGGGRTGAVARQHGQGLVQAVHGRAGPTRRDARAARHRHRRDCDPQRS